MTPDENNVDPDLRKILQIPDDQELPPEALCDVMIRALESHQLLIRTSAVHQLIELGKNHPEMAIPKMLKALDPSVDYWTVRFGCVEALGDIADKRVIKPLIEYLRNDEDPDFRAMVAKQLGEMGTEAKGAGDALIEALENKDSSEVRENAAYAIGKIKTKKACKPLCKALKEEKDEYAKRQMCWALGELEDPYAIETLIEKLKDSDKETRAKAAEALGKIGHPDVVMPLLKATQDTVVEVQSKAIEALKKIENKIVVAEIEKAAKGDKLVAIQYYEEYMFNIENENIAKRLKEIKEPVINEYREEMTKIKTDLEGCKVFVEETFGKMREMSEKELEEIINKKLPQIESRVASVSLYKFRKLKWLENELFFDLDKITELYKEAGIMTSELRDNIQALIQKKKTEENIIENKEES